MKIIAYYLPQFHIIPENNTWWGEGFTEWVNVKKAKPLYEGHYQPRIPQNKNYYDLTDPKTIRWQSELAQRYGVYGFCIYHYWFNGKLLLQKPLEMYRDMQECKTHYCICWANEDWTDQWVSDSARVLIKETYGNKEEWRAHFEYMLSFFRDERYIKEDNKPFLVLYDPSIVMDLEAMLEYWNRLAKDNGFDGLIIAAQSTRGRLDDRVYPPCIDYQIDYEPQYAYSLLRQKKHPYLRRCKRTIQGVLKKYFNTNMIDRIGQNKELEILYYDDVWRKILNTQPQNEKCIPGAFVDWDNTSRKGNRGFVIHGASPDKFGFYLEQQIKRAMEVYHKDKLFIFAWNEWGECGYLEPDERYEELYLKEIKKVLDSITIS